MPTPAPETITVETDKFYCDGAPVGEKLRMAGAGVLGHPRVYLVMNKSGFVDCPYCDRHFVLAAGAKAAAH